MRWLSKPIVLAIHQENIARFGGEDGIRDEALLESAIARPQNHAAYSETPDLPHLAAIYCAGIVRNHPFVDGNKRTGLVSTATFLALNGYLFQPDRVEAVLVIEQLAAGTLSDDQLAAWIQKNISRRKAKPNRF